MGRQQESSIHESFLKASQDYRAAKTSRFRPKLKGVSLSGSGADYHYRNERDYLYHIELARDLERNDPIAGQALTRFIDNLTQGGFSPDPNTGDAEVNKRQKEFWNEWSNDPEQCHSEREFNFNKIDRLTWRSECRDGDHVALLRDDLSLQPVENHRVRTPTNALRRKTNIVHGFTLDNDGVRQKLFITRESFAAHETVTRINQVDELDIRDASGNRQVLHLYDPTRTSQRRGISVFAPITNLTGMHDDLQFAMLVKAQVASCYAIFRELTGGNPPNLPGQTGERTEETRPDGTTRTLQGVSPGMEIFGFPGEKLSGFSPNVPNSEFFDHMFLVLSIIAVNLKMPVHVLLLDPTKTNFSGWRGAIDQARIQWKVMQKERTARFHAPIYRWVMRGLAVRDPKMRAKMLNPKVDYFRHTWNLPRCPYMDPLKDISARKLQLSESLISPRRDAQENGSDWEEIYTECIEDRSKAVKEAKRVAKAINDEYQQDGEPVSWRELMPLPTSANMQLLINAGEPQSTVSSNSSEGAVSE